ncbi:MAG: filamentous hemagglutinin N-terminal domain-containing protein, partial [Chromatiales bacterium]|nr:filamentous hemagglutinin N-terminal domain-containing protein [Chromatiales bacterium]
MSKPRLSKKPRQVRSLSGLRRLPISPLTAMIRRGLLASAGVALTAPFASSVLASPQGGNVVAGQGAIAQPNANTTVITQQSQNVVINWQSFDLAQQDLVQFNQPSSSAAALNRILNGSPSKILGTIQSNGKVFLVNPTGIIFGRGSRMNVGSLFASSLDISNQDFMAGSYTFSGTQGVTPGAIINQGHIEAAIGGSVTLVGGAVGNEGTIVANLGHVNLGAGTEVVVDFAGDGLIHFAVSGEVAEQVAGAQSAIDNSGQITAEGGQITLSARTARGVFDNIVNNSGSIRAGRIDRSGGKIRLVGMGGSVRNSGSLDASGTSGGEISVSSDINVASSGTITADASSGTGGTVTVQSGDTTMLSGSAVVSANSRDGVGGSIALLGPQVGATDSATVTASGGSGGGTILIGGELRGTGSTPTSRAVYLGEATQVRADATGNGDGGTVIVWSDEVSRVYGSLSARGGATGGNGGFIETSSGGFLDVTQAVDVSAAFGQGGEWLIDPDDIEIIVGANVAISAGPNFTSTAEVSKLNVTALTAALTGGATVRVVTADAGGNATRLGNITVTADIDFNNATGDNSLSLEALGNIFVNANISDTAGADQQLNLNLSANGSVSLAAGKTIDLFNGTLDVASTATSFDSSAAGASLVTTGA